MAYLTRLRAPSGAIGYRSPALAAAGVPHWFATRALEGADEDERERDLGPLDAARAARLAEAAGAPGRGVVRVHQVHGARVVEVDEADAEPLLRADAIVATEPRALALVRAADCVPVLLATPDGSRVAAVHAGWRGIVAGAIPAALERLDAGAPVVAAVGPCISAAHFEVGEDVADEFRSAELGECVLERDGARPLVDLRRAARLQIQRASPGATVDESDRCTYAHGAELWSHRRDVTHGGARSTGRQGAVIGVRSEGSTV